MFLYWTEDDFASSFRKMLTLEQFRSEEMQQLYQQYLVSGPSEYVKKIYLNIWGFHLQKISGTILCCHVFLFTVCMMGQRTRMK